MSIYVLLHYNYKKVICLRFYFQRRKIAIDSSASARQFYIWIGARLLPCQGFPFVFSPISGLDPFNLLLSIYFFQFYYSVHGSDPYNKFCFENSFSLSNLRLFTAIIRLCHPTRERILHVRCYAGITCLLYVAMQVSRALITNN